MLLLNYSTYFLIIPAISISLLVSIDKSIIFSPVNAAPHSRHRTIYLRDTPVYDREISMFNQHGRLAQVEYGLESSIRGSAVGAIQISTEYLGDVCDRHLTEDDDDDDEREKRKEIIEGKAFVCVCIENSSFGKMHRIDDHIWMLTSGLSGDSRMLANIVRTECQRHRLKYGEQPTTKQAARMSAEFYHQLTRTGGCRPLGCACILIGISNEDCGGTATTRIYLVDPIGGVEERPVVSIGNARIDLGKELKSLATQFDHGNNIKEVNGAKTLDSTKAGRGRHAHTNSIRIVASSMANRFLAKLDETNIGSAATIDVWTIQPKKHRRGGMLATCYSGIQTKNIPRYFKQDIFTHVK